ncbi:leucine-rich repeat, cysteine-containing subtype protein [Tanacetum coccineum]
MPFRLCAFCYAFVAHGYCINYNSCLSKRFPFIESLTLKGPPLDFHQTHYHDIRITPWIELLAFEFRCLKELCICGLVVHDEDLETLARTRGKELRTLKIKTGHGFLTLGLRTTDMPQDNGIRAMLMGCSKLEKLDITLERLDMHGGLTNVGLEYIRKYGANLKSLFLTCIRNSNAALVKFLEGCSKLRKLKLTDCPFSKQVVTNFVFNMPSLRYVWIKGGDRDHNVLALMRPNFQL